MSAYFYLLLGCAILFGGFLSIIWRPSPEGGAPGCAIKFAGLHIVLTTLEGALLGY